MCCGEDELSDGGGDGDVGDGWGDDGGPVGSELPPPPLPPTTFVSTSPSPDPVLYGGNLFGVFGWLQPPPNSLSFASTPLPFQWMSRPSTAVAVWGASGLGISPSASLSRLLYL
uniref:Uncharacterized protein n=1 Tax=Fagus sylvatica TaxID=28930 RepID=A0A2N9G9G9_FAGSY